MSTTYPDELKLRIFYNPVKKEYIVGAKQFKDLFGYGLTIEVAVQDLIKTMRQQREIFKNSSHDSFFEEIGHLDYYLGDEEEDE